MSQGVRRKGLEQEEAAAQALPLPLPSWGGLALQKRGQGSKSLMSL